MERCDNGMRYSCRHDEQSACRGAVTIQLAVALVAIIGFVSLGTEVVVLLLISVRMQSAADTAALAAVTARIQGYPTDYTVEAFAMTAEAGFANGRNGTVVTINNPPRTGNFTTVSDAVEVLISEPQTVSLARVVYPGPFTVGARAVARGGQGAPIICVLALEPTATGYSESGGTANVTLNNCDLAANSTSSQGISLGGGAKLTANGPPGGHVSVAGNYALSGGSTMTAAGGITTSAPTTADPYASYTIPAFSGCNFNNYTAPNGVVLSPGVYCNGFTVQGGNTVTLNPGIYIIDRGAFTVGGGTSTVNGTGVTIVLTSSTGTGYATMTISGNLNLTAPTSGPTAGLVFFQDRRAPTNGTDAVNGGSTLKITGGLYFPAQTLNYTGSGTQTSTCTQLVARVIALQTATLGGNCAGTGVPSTGGGAAMLVE